MSIKTLLAAVLFCAFSASALADVIALRPDAPERYTVRKGDTLWDISAHFLDSPWRWPEVWSFNPQIDNPHLIYPGDVVVLSYDESGRPILSVERSSAPAMKLSPQVRATRIDAPISTIPLDAIRQFIGLPRVISEEELNNSGIMVASLDEHLIAGKGDEIYAQGLNEAPEDRFVVFRIGQVYRNEGAPRDEILGYEAMHVADATASEYGDKITTLHITHSNRESLVGDRLLPSEGTELNQNFLPHAPTKPVDGQIIAVFDGVSRIGQYMTVVLNQGQNAGMEPGLVLGVYQKGRSIPDRYSKDRGDTVKLPDARAGIVMVIKAYDHISYALVMDADRDMKVYDKVGNP